MSCAVEGEKRRGHVARRPSAARSPWLGGALLAAGLACAPAAGVVAGPGRGAGGQPPPPAQAPTAQSAGMELQVPDRLLAPPLRTLTPLTPEQDLLSRARRRADGRYVLASNGIDVPLTLHGELHERANALLRRSGAPYSAAVIMDPATGRVLALAEHSEVLGAQRGLTTRAVFPAASVFKVITTSALLQEGLSAADGVCSHGGGHLITREQLLDGPADRECHTLGAALARSVNATFAKLTFKYLSAEKLRRRAEAFGFNRPLSFPIPTDVSRASFDGGPVMLAATGAGFGNVFLSPLHAAAIAATMANGGRWRPPLLFEHQLTYAHDAAGPSIMPAQEARTLAQMLQHTVTEGSARRAFGPEGARLRAAGKTGTLSDADGRLYSWFIGFAPEHAPEVAIAVVTVNTAGRKVPAAWLARQLLRLQQGSEDVLDPPPSDEEVDFSSQ